MCAPRQMERSLLLPNGVTAIIVLEESIVEGLRAKGLTLSA